MIRLVRGERPAYLTAEIAAELLERYRNSSARVWNNDELKTALLLSSHGKCSFCECSLTSEAMYMEVEHFHYKDKYPDGVIEWENLLPVCKRCNVSKGTHDVVAEPIVNPFIDDPRSHLDFKLYRFSGRDEIGSNTIEVVSLNDSERAVKARFLVGETVQESIQQCLERLQLYQDQNSPIRRNKLVRAVLSLLLICQKESSYAATAATVLHGSEDFESIKAVMLDEGMWSDEMQHLHDAALLISYG